MAERLPTLSPAVLRDVCDILAATDCGMTNKQIDRVLAEASIEDPNPQPASPLVYRAINKRDRLFEALDARQVQDGCSNYVLRFIELAMQPARFRAMPATSEDWQDALNQALSFAGLEISDQGKVRRLTRPATTLSEARERGRRFRKKLEERGVHPRILCACRPEIEDENFFHTVLEASKSVAEEIRQKTGLTSDGAKLIDEALAVPKGGHPRLAFNRLATPTERSAHQGFANMLRGMFGAMRNPTAHEPKAKVAWHIGERDALDMLTFMSMLHRQLDDAFAVPTMASAAANSP